MPLTWDLHERRVGKRDADSLALATVHPVIAIAATVEAIRLPTGTAQDACPITPGERGNDQVTTPQVADIRADVLDDADELVADRSGIVR